MSNEETDGECSGGFGNKSSGWGFEGRLMKCGVLEERKNCGKWNIDETGLSDCESLRKRRT